jgi:nucleoside-diphosphate-sugar epimerase
MKVAIYGANGAMGPHVVRALEGEHELRLSDVNDLEGSPHEYRKIDVADLDAVVDAAEGMDAIINLSVLRDDRKIAFDVNARGCYNVMTAAVTHGVRRVVNTGPHFTLSGATYERFDYDVGPDIPAQPGTNLYALTKSLGHEICRVFTRNHDVYVIGLFFYNFRPEESQVGQDLTPYSVTWEDTGRAFASALSVDLDTLPSRWESFFVFADLPHNKFDNEKVKRLLGWRPTHDLHEFWTKSS